MTTRTRSELNTLFADNSSGNISTEDLRDCADSAVLNTEAGDLVQLHGSLLGNVITPPVLANFPTWVNQGSTTATQTDYGINMILNTGPSGLDLKMKMKTVPSAPYIVTTGICYRSGFFACGSGIALRDSGTGKVVMHGCQSNPIAENNSYLWVGKWDSTSSYNSSYLFAFNTFALHHIYYRIQDNNTNRICSVSNDGVNFLTLSTVSRTDFITPDQIGFFIYNNTNTTSNMGQYIFHYLEE